MVENSTYWSILNWWLVMKMMMITIYSLSECFSHSVCMSMLLNKVFGFYFVEGAAIFMSEREREKEKTGPPPITHIHIINFPIFRLKLSMKMRGLARRGVASLKWYYHYYYYYWSHVLYPYFGVFFFFFLEYSIAIRGRCYFCIYLRFHLLLFFESPANRHREILETNENKHENHSNVKNQYCNEYIEKCIESCACSKWNEMKLN